MRFPEECGEWLRREMLAWDRYVVDDDLEAYQEVLRERDSVLKSLPPSAWGLGEGTMIFVTGDQGVKSEMFRVGADAVGLEVHNGKDWWFPARESAYEMVWKIRSGRAMLLEKVEARFDNYSEGL